ncbi:hypothetical protein CRENBAI_014337 [Crenichthys baileyi]|uniref:Uncharacterized protein n=1 Tax=Crenichthys baileyi TaxID=28760 RepID=A0AAV9S4M8_9TELE
MHVATVERKNSLLTGRNLQQNQAQCERPSATTDWGLERTEQRHKENKEAPIQEYFLWEGKVNVNGCSSFSQQVMGCHAAFQYDTSSLHIWSFRYRTASKCLLCVRKLYDEIYPLGKQKPQRPSEIF